MLTGSDYRASLRDGRSIFIDGHAVEDPNKEAALRGAIDWVADGYDRHYSAAAGAQNPLMSAPTSSDELRERVRQLREADILMSTTFQSLMTLLTAAPIVGEALPESAERMYAYFEDCKRADVRLTECITDAKGDRSLPPSKQADPDSYVRVVKETSDGVVIRGSKLHITGAALGHDLVVMPTKKMKSGEEQYAIACAVPVASSGVHIVNTTYAPRTEDDRHFPFTRRESMPDGFVVFDDVFVPMERVFLNGDTRFSATFAHSLGLWERLGGTAAMAEDADLLVGLAYLIADANGLNRIDHIREKISELIIHATLIRAGLEAALFHAHETPDGYFYPDELYTNAAKYHGAANYNLMVRHLHDIAGGAVLTAPTIGDLENEITGPYVAKYMSTRPDIDAEYRMRLFHAIRDITADAFGGWNFVTNVQSGGGLWAQRIVTRKHYDMDRAVELAKRAAGIAD